MYLDEASFLHHLSTPVSVAEFLVRNWIDSQLANSGGVNSNQKVDVADAQKILECINKIMSLLNERRNNFQAEKGL